MRTEQPLHFAHKPFYVDLGRDVIDNKSVADPASPPIKDCHSPTSPLVHYQTSPPIFSSVFSNISSSSSSSMPPSQLHHSQLPVVASAAEHNSSSSSSGSHTEPDHGAAVDVQPQQQQQQSQSQPQQFHTEEARRVSFTAAWPHAFLDTDLLAQTGFYFIGPNDNVKCFFCKVEIGRWETDDHEVTEHQRWSQNCPLLRRRSTNNVPIDAAALDRVLPPVTIDVCGPGGIDVRHNTISEGSFDVYPAMGAGSVGVTMPVHSAATSVSAAAAAAAAGSGGVEVALHDVGPTALDVNMPNGAPHQLLHQQHQFEQQHPLQHQHQSVSISVQTPPSIRYPDHPEFAIESARLRSFDDWPKTMRQKPKALSDAGFFYTLKGDRVKCFSCGGGLRDWDENDVPWEQHALWFSHCQYLLLIKGPEYVQEIHRQAAEAKRLAEEQAAAGGDAAGAEPLSAEAAAAAAQAAAAAVTAAAEVAAAAEASSAAPLGADDASGGGAGGRNCDSKLCKICYSCEYNTAFLPCGHVVACAKCASSVTKCPMCRKPFDCVMRVYFS